MKTKDSTCRTTKPPCSDNPAKSERFFPLKVRGKNINFENRTLVMGILNVTPDSFYKDSRFSDLDSSIKRIDKMIEEGADIIDIGAESTRPGSKGISVQEELDRLMPVVEKAVSNFDIIYSVDTTKAEVAKEVLSSGVSIINDISGLKFDPLVGKYVAEYDAGIVLMHTPSLPHNMQDFTEYNSLIDDIMKYINDSLNVAAGYGIGVESTIVDPGIGFGKTLEQNLTLINRLDSLLELKRPILIGTSRKSFIGKILGSISKDKRLEGTLASVAVSVIRGASIVRVHDVLQTKLVTKVVDEICSAKYN